MCWLGHQFLITGLINSVTSWQLCRVHSSYYEAQFYTATYGKSLPFDLSICSSRSLLSASWFKVFQIFVPISYRAVIQGKWMVNKELWKGHWLTFIYKMLKGLFQRWKTINSQVQEEKQYLQDINASRETNALVSRPSNLLQTVTVQSKSIFWSRKALCVSTFTC